MEVDRECNTPTTTASEAFHSASSVSYELGEPSEKSVRVATCRHRTTTLFVPRTRHVWACHRTVHRTASGVSCPKMFGSRYFPCSAAGILLLFPKSVGAGMRSRTLRMAFSGVVCTLDNSLNLRCFSSNLPFSHVQDCSLVHHNRHKLQAVLGQQSPLFQLTCKRCTPF